MKKSDDKQSKQAMYRINPNNNLESTTNFLEFPTIFQKTNYKI